jgi:hypothetical protein
MTFSSFLRTVGAGRRTTQSGSARASHARPGTAPQSPRSGLNVSPVHGHHCICTRCSPDERERLPLVG